MPKTLQAVNSGPFKNATVVPQPGDARVAADIEKPVSDLLNNAAYLLAQLEAVVGQLQSHGHELATDTQPGFMSPGNKQKLDSLSDQLATHAHLVATTLAPGFMSKDDKIRLNGIEDKAQVVTRARVETALGILYGEITIPESSYSAGQTKGYQKAHQGVKYDAPILTSETLKSDAFLMTYHAEDNQVSVKIKNLNSGSKTFPGGTVRYQVNNNGAA